MTPVATTRATPTAHSIVRVALAALLLATVVSVVGPASHPAPVSAGTADYIEGLLLKWVNDYRAKRGIAPLRAGSKLQDLAGDRAASMASAGRLYHPSCLSCLLRTRGIVFSSCGEVIAYTTYPWGYDAAKAIFNGWRNSSGHWSILMSKTFTRVGFGVAYRSKSHTTYASGILAR